MDAISKFGTAVSPYIVDLGGAENPGMVNTTSSNQKVSGENKITVYADT